MANIDCSNAIEFCKKLEELTEGIVKDGSIAAGTGSDNTSGSSDLTTDPENTQTSSQCTQSSSNQSFASQKPTTTGKKRTVGSTRGSNTKGKAKSVDDHDDCDSFADDSVVHNQLEQHLIGY